MDGTYCEINSITSSASGASVYYVKIDGKILVNSGTDLSGLTNTHQSLQLVVQLEPSKDSVS